jgi:2-desacetyl-2-hydroxyethyl bacteriochlorophyllide A dehydrogenase
MKRLIITGPRQAVFEEVEMPACASDGVVVRAKVTAISAGTELRVYRTIPVDDAGLFIHETRPFALPVENGYSMVGEIVEVGAQVDGLAVGQRVFVSEPHKEFVAVSATAVVPLADEIPDEEAALLRILEVAHNGLRQGHPPVGGDVAVIGQGVVGLSITAYAEAFGMRTVVIDKNENRLAIAREVGALLALNPTEDRVAEQVVELFDNAGADVTYEATSKWAGIRTAMEVTRNDGVVVIVSRNTEKPDFNPIGHPFLGKRLNVVTSCSYQSEDHRWSQKRSLALTLDLLTRRRLNVAPILTHEFAWHELPSVYERLDEGDRSIVGTTIRWG